MGENPALRRVLWVVSALLLVVGLVAVPLVAGDDKSDQDADLTLRTGSKAAPDSATTETTDAGGDGGGGDAAVSAGSTLPEGKATVTPTTAATASPATTSGPASTLPPTTTAKPEELGTPTDPGPVQVPKDGTYRYKSTASGGQQAGERETTTKIENKGKTGDDTRVTVTKAGGNFDSANDTSWKPDGVRTLVSHFSFGSNKGECDWEPDALELKLPLAKGVTWTSETSCMLTGIGPSPIPVSRSIKGDVLGLKRIRVGGVVVDVWEIKRDETFSGGGQSGDTKSTVFYSPKHGIEVLISGTATSSQGTFDYRQELLSLSPAS